MKKLLLIACLAACGSSDPTGDPLVASTLTGKFAGSTFKPTSGYVRDDVSGFRFVLGANGVSCDDDPETDELTGTTLYVTTQMVAVGTDPDASFEFERITSTSFTGLSSSGTLTIAGISATEVSATLSFSSADTDGKQYAMTGDVTVTRCAF